MLLSSPAPVHRCSLQPKPASAAWQLLCHFGVVLLMAVCLALAAPAARAEGVDLTGISTSRTEEGLDLSFSTRFELPRAAEDALMKGVSLYFVAEVSLQRKRWYWRDARVAKVSRGWRLYWYALTRQYRVSSGGLTQSFNNLPDALASLRGVSGWRIAEARELDEDGNHYLEFAYRLDTSQLPKPMQIGLSVGQGWNLSVDHVFGLNPDFSPRTAAAP
ncbi:MAG: hypothetical protein CFE41_14100 [Burkholderiales bacterium PBB2]|nr:MAG: hypothetical protein CFE41_14100 [Burkholderiales bacterium PBB2]